MPPLRKSESKVIAPELLRMEMIGNKKDTHKYSNTSPVPEPVEGPLPEGAPAPEPVEGPVAEPVEAVEAVKVPVEVPTAEPLPSKTA